MDCEKYEPLLLDELYEELDEVTSAAVKRHVAGCARCAASLASMTSTRRLAALPMDPVPEGLEDRILAAVKEAQKVVPMQSRLSRVITVAGSWAMRPQTAMAAVFLLMIGSSAFVIRARHHAPAQAVSVTELGEPAAISSPADRDVLDNKTAAAAHGPASPAPMAAPAPMATAAASALAFAERSPRGPSAARAERSTEDEGLAQNFAVGALESEALKKAEAPSADRGRADAPRSSTASRPLDVQDGFSAGMASYRARDFGEATRLFDQAAKTGDVNAALWAARSVKEGSGCGAAMSRFEAIARAGSAWENHEADLEVGRCQIAMGQHDEARARLTRLSSIGSHAAQAQQALASLDQVAARRKAAAPPAKAGTGGGTPGAGAHAHPAAPSPVAPANTKPSTTGY